MLLWDYSYDLNYEEGFIYMPHVAPNTSLLE